MIENRNKYVQIIENIKLLPKVFGGKFLHLGCGKNIYDGWINVDKYYNDGRVRREDIFSLSDDENSVEALYSSHSLEHLPIRHAQLALANWHKVLRVGGKLYLAIPDLELTMHCILNKGIRFEDRYNWFMYVLFGYQTSCEDLNPTINASIDQGQFHTCGFTEESIRHYLSVAGFKINELFHYDGFNTPSIYVEAEK